MAYASGVNVSIRVCAFTVYDCARSCNGWSPRAPRRLKPAARVRCRIAHGDLRHSFSRCVTMLFRFARCGHLAGGVAHAERDRGKHANPLLARRAVPGP